MGEPSKLSRSNPGTRCFACEERHAASKLEVAAANKKEEVLERGETNEPRRAESSGLEERVRREQTDAERAREILELAKRSVLNRERGLRSALASGDVRLVRRWSRSLREAEEVWLGPKRTSPAPRRG